MPDAKIAVFLHLYYVDLWPEFRNYLKNFKSIPFDLYINLVIDTWFPLVSETILHDYPNANIIISENRGQDIGGLLNMIRFANLQKYENICLAHDKKSLHAKNVDKWRNKLLDAIIGDHKTIQDNLRILNDSNTGILGSNEWHFHCTDRHEKTLSGTNNSKLTELCEEMQISTNLNCKYIAGTIMWVKRPILEILKQHEPFLAERMAYRVQLNGGWEHAVERIFGPIAKHLKLKSCGVPQITGRIPD